MLKFIIADLQEGVRVPVAGEYDAKTIDIEFADMSYRSAICVEGEIEKSGNTLRFQGVLTTRVNQTCGRCLKENDRDVREDFDWIYTTDGKESIEPVDNVRELLILDHPLVYLCREDCKGLCPVCGKDLNENPCKCRQSSYHSFPVIKKKSKKEQ